jgi:hypothetical protein
MLSAVCFCMPNFVSKVHIGAIIERRIFFGRCKKDTNIEIRNKFEGSKFEFTKLDSRLRGNDKDLDKLPAISLR